MFDLDDCVAYVTCKSAKALAHRLEKRLESYDVTRVQWTAMYYVSKDELITQKKLSEKMSLRESTIVRLIDRMEKDGLLERVNSQQDKRVHNLVLTSKGDALNQKLTAVANQFKNDAIANISQEDLSTFKAVLEQMLADTEINERLLSNEYFT
ncbi:MarR family transcriptional regulator [Oscillospiraceae bacterium PP1C4]